MEEAKKNILIVEDELIISLMLEQMVENLGHNVLAKVTSGEEAIEVANTTQPDLILMDIRLQGDMDGIETMEEIRKSLNVPVIYITGNTDNLYRKRVEQSDYMDFLTKPITMNDLSRSFNFAS